MKIKFIVNPASGKQIGQQKVARVIERLTADSVLETADVFYTQGKRDAFEEACRLQTGEYDLVVAVGGDGTVHEVVNGLIHGGCAIPLGLMPYGTVNDFGQFINAPDDIEGICQMIKGYQLKPVDVGKVGDTYFLNVFAGGVFTDISYKCPRELKMVLGELAYYVAGAVNIPANIFKSYSLEISHDGQVSNEQALIFIIANSSSVGGFKKICPNALIDDGLLDVCIIRKTAIENLIPLVFRLFKGEHLDSPHVAYFQTDRLEIRRTNEAEGELFMDMDGEQTGNLPAVIEAAPRALKLLIP